jgi:hypothetical protein
MLDEHRESGYEDAKKPLKVQFGLMKQWRIKTAALWCMILTTRPP